MKTKRFAVLVIAIALILGVLIYWREYGARDQVSLLKVLIWQLVIWIPWIAGFMVLKKTYSTNDQTNNRHLFTFAMGLVLIVVHYGWFFLISSSFSPYLGLEGSRFGVYRYFFIFWTLIDIGLVWYCIEKIREAEAKEEPSPAPTLFELTRGTNKYYCEPSQIYWLVSENYYTRLFTTEGLFVMRKSLKSFHDVLPENLFRKIHRSTIINIDYVAELTRGTGSSLEVVMKDGTRRRVSKSYVKDITDLFKNRSH